MFYLPDNLKLGNRLGQLRMSDWIQTHRHASASQIRRTMSFVFPEPDDMTSLAVPLSSTKTSLRYLNALNCCATVLAPLFGKQVDGVTLFVVLYVVQHVRHLFLEMRRHVLVNIGEEVADWRLGNFFDFFDVL